MGKRRKRSTPPFMLRRVALFCILMCISGLSGFFNLLPAVRGKLLWTLLIQGFMFVLMMGLTLWFVLTYLRVTRAVREMGGKVCWHCGYSLRGLADEGTCPECGRGYTLAELKQRWMPEAQD